MIMVRSAALPAVFFSNVLCFPDGVHTKSAQTLGLFSGEEGYMILLQTIRIKLPIIETDRWSSFKTWNDSFTGFCHLAHGDDFPLVSLINSIQVLS